MNAKRPKAEHVLYGIGLFGPARTLYALTAGHDGRRQRNLKRCFYSQLLEPGDLVLDVGANLATYAQLFASVGAGGNGSDPIPTASAKSDANRPNRCLWAQQ